MVPGLSIEHIVILGIIALVVVGPKDLPLLLRKMGQWTARLRAMAQEFRSGFDDLARQAELDELKREVDALRRTTNLTSIGKEITKPLGTLESYAGISPPPMTDSKPLSLEGGEAGAGVIPSASTSSASSAADPSTPHLPASPLGEGNAARDDNEVAAPEPRVASAP